MTGVALHVHDGVDTYGVGIGAGASANNNDLAPDVLLNELVGFVHVHGGRFHLWNVYVGVVYGVGAAGVAVEEGEAFG